MLLKARLAMILPLVLLSTGCAAQKEVLSQRDPIPDNLLTCLPQPPAPTVRKDTSIANYILDLAIAGGDCRAKLAEVRALKPTPGG